jgi:hypothetical protein
MGGKKGKERRKGGKERKEERRKDRREVGRKEEETWADVVPYTVVHIPR